MHTDHQKHTAQRRQNVRHPQLDDQPTVEQPDQRPTGEADQHRRHRAPAEHYHHITGDHQAHRRHRTNRQIESTDGHGQGHAQCQQRHDRH